MQEKSINQKHMQNRIQKDWVVSWKERFKNYSEDEHINCQKNRLYLFVRKFDESSD